MVHMHFVVTSFSMRSGEYFAIFDRDLVEFNRSSLNLVITLTDLVTGAELRTTRPPKVLKMSALLLKISLVSLGFLAS